MKPGSPSTENVKMISSLSDQQDEQPIDYQYGYPMTDNASNSISDSYSIVSLSPEIDHSLQTIINKANESNGRLTTSSPESPMQAIQVDLTPRTKVGFEREAAWLREQLDRAQRDLAASINQNLLLHFRIQRLQTQLVVEHKERNEQEALLQEAQQKAYSLLEHANWESDTEKTIRRLDQFGKHIQQWCKQYSVKLALHEGADTEAVRVVLGRLIPVGKDANSFNEMGLKSTGMVLQACLTDYLFQMTIENPFYFFDSRMQVDFNTLTNQTAKEGMLSKELVGTYFDAFSYDESEANKWRAHTLRLLCPRSNTQDFEKNELISRIGERTQTAIKHACSKLASAFLESWGSCLIGMEQDQEMRQSLFQLFHEAGQLSYYLGTQKFDVRVARLDNLHVKEFHHQNQFMEAHSSHQIQLDQDEAALDGQEIYLMLHPAIIAFGTADGSDYHRYTIWKKAVLWMGYSN